MRTVASYLGHANVSMTLDTYADVDPDAKKAAVAKVAKAFDVDMSFPTDSPARDDAGAARNAGLMFTVEQLRAMLAEAEKGEAGHAGA